MKSIRTFVHRVGGLMGKNRGDCDLSEEIEANLQLHIDDNLRAGMSRDEARRQALMHLGGI